MVASLVACSEGPPERPDGGHGSPVTSKSPATVASPSAGTTTVASEPAGPVVESTVGGAVLRRDVSVLKIERAELLRSRDGDEIFVRTTIEEPVGYKDCFLMTEKTWLAFKNALDGGDPSDLPATLESSWADASSTQRFSSGDFYAVSFREDTSRKDDAPDPRNTPFFVLCFKDVNPSSPTWYDTAHVEGSPKAS